MKTKDYLIVGQGLAGSILAYELLERQKTVHIVDDADGNISSTVAAGLYNPVTGRKMVKTWLADDLFPSIKPYYQKIDTRLGIKSLIEKEIYRPFLGIDEYNDWVGRSADDKFKNYVAHIYPASRDEYSKIVDPHGGVALQSCGYLRVNLLVDKMRQYFRSKEVLTTKCVDHQDILIEKDTLVYQGVNYRKLILCNGYSPLLGGWFDWLPFKPVKGEIMTIKHLFNFDYILNRGVFMIPIDEGISRVGATYDHDLSSLSPSEKAKGYLKEKLSSLISFEYEIINHHVGVRPATLDRRPLIGQHPSYKQIGIFNGFGSKGVSLVPYFAGLYADSLEKSKKLIPEVDIKRYFSLLNV